MGVRHLVNAFKPFAERQFLKGSAVVIDGNSFAYHIYNICLNTRPTARNTFEAQPIFSDLEEIINTWLDALCKSEINVEKIFFDGFLPDFKLQTRLNRLRTLTLRLHKYHESHSTLSQKSDYRTKTNVSLFESCPIPIKISSCPPPPFLVSAVLEILRKSEKYKNATEVVPWEADLYCGNFVKKNGGLVLTADSDLLIHDLGPDGKVIFFKDIEKSFEGFEMYASTYHPFNIKNKLDLGENQGLFLLAFELQNNPTYHTLDKALKMANSLKTVSKFPLKYEKFIAEYTTLLVEPVPQIQEKALEVVLSQFSSLDPRVSEYVLQFPRFAKITRQPLFMNSSNHVSHRIFLPFLFDSPVRTSGWETSTAVRLLAYGLVNIVLPKEENVASVLEYRRQRVKFGGRELKLLDNEAIPIACRKYSELILELRKKLPNLKNCHTWIALAIFQEIEWSQYHQKPSLSELVTKSFSVSNHNFNLDETYEWELIHLLAQIDGSFYSFRILSQVIGLLIAYKWGNDIPQALLSLYQLLETLPEVKDFFDRSSTARFLSTHLVGIVFTANEILGTAEGLSNKQL